MFNLVELEDTIQILPECLDQVVEAIHYEINKKFANKVIKDVGLCICLFDILKIGHGSIYQGDGSVFSVVRFRIAVFKPFLGEVIVGTIKYSSEEALQVTLGFFDQIWILASSLQQPSVFEKSDQLWAWKYQDHLLWLNPGDQIRFRVEKIVFNPPTSRKPGNNKPSDPSGGPSDDKNCDPTASNDPESPLSALMIFGSISESGLGSLSWWNSVSDASAVEDAATDNCDPVDTT
ncbi:DNA-directed RNA polymerase III subunit RPC8-like [Schistocerca gregaria]|uniref:DNA-directed RNA polymerase III subunit RPC8-like n=1 Tax=Schistocerca gregaria TaxID=7010 RepID=UPI00211EDB1D|nr:DNA-directed RNA polymerase III subunit RPC8-like [Schistocerca gregaria]